MSDRIEFRTICEPQLGQRMRQLFLHLWPRCKEWFLVEGIAARPTYLASRRALRRYMPELVPLYEKFCELVGGDLEARFLSMFCPPAYFPACSQAVWNNGEPLLVRNYDYAPTVLDAVILCTNWHGKRVIAMSDDTWGVVDGINEDGLAVSLAFGGRRIVGDGFGITLILRYILEFCRTVHEATEVLRRIPSHMAYNVTIVDASGDYCTAYLAPDRETIISKDPAATNHQQQQVEWLEHATCYRTVERQQFLLRNLEKNISLQRFTDLFLQQPLYTRDYQGGFGTLYTAVYYPQRGCVEYRWPEYTWKQSIDEFIEGSVEIVYNQSSI